MKYSTIISVAFCMAVFFSMIAPIQNISAAANEKQPYEMVIKKRTAEGLKYIQDDPWPSPVKNIDFADSMALLLLFKNENVEEANRLILAFCGRDPLTPYAGKRIPKVRCESLFRIYLLERTRQAVKRRGAQGHRGSCVGAADQIQSRNHTRGCR